MIVESWIPLKIGDIVQIGNYEIQSEEHITINAKVIRESTEDEYIKDVIEEVSEKERIRYQERRNLFYYEVKED